MMLMLETRLVLMQNDAIAAVQAATDTVTGRSSFIPIPHTQNALLDSFILFFRSLNI